ncbi:MAG: NINE protein [Aureispira sp.]|nr:NINE protein [Aureispira sp.]
MKSKGIAYLLWVVGFFGALGLHRFYLEKIGTGILWLFTGGLLGVGSLIDLFTLGGKVDQYNTNVELKTIRKTTAAYVATQAAKEGVIVDPPKKKKKAIGANEPMDDILDIL